MGEDLTVTAREEKSDGWGYDMVVIIPRQHVQLGPAAGLELQFSRRLTGHEV